MHTYKVFNNPKKTSKGKRDITNDTLSREWNPKCNRVPFSFDFDYHYLHIKPFYIPQINGSFFFSSFGA
jgi:hypothetical protein